uniref:Integrase catalytic domain-containing protein n=1 Tax=Fagus sylvatica TaxID=28930 RepID=A0A2N9HU52_FAGSY
MIDHIDGSVPKPSQYLIGADGSFTTGANPSFLSWKKRDKALLTLIYSTLSPPVLSMVVGLNSAQEVWNTLEQRFTSTARANVLNLKLELQSVKKGNDSINAYMQRVKTARDKLSAVGVQIDDEEMLHMILKGLPKEYYSFNSAIRTRDDSLTFEKTFLAIPTSTKAEEGISIQKEAEEVADMNPNSFNKPEHNRPVCQICGKVGHYAIDCYHRMDFAYQGKNPPTKLAAMANASNINITQGNNDTCLTDSGASDHITANLNNLNQPIPFKGPEQVSVGNGQNLPIQNIGKMHKLPFPISVPKSEFPLHVLHADLWGPAPIQSYNGFRYYLVIVDDYTKFCWVYLLKNKSDTFTTFQQFKAMAEKHYNSSIHFLRTDCGSEFTSTAFNSYCATFGIIHHLTCPHTPQQNGVAERKHRHLIQTTLALLSQSGLSLSYWSYAFATTSHLINKLPTPLLNMSSPWEQLHNVKPDLSYLKTFGCKCFPLLTPYNTHKLQPKTIPCIFLGYPPTTKGYLCQDPITKRSYISRHVVFNETEFPACDNPAKYSPSDPKSYSPYYWLNHLLSTHSCTSLFCSHCLNPSSSVQPSNPNTVIAPSHHTPIDLPTVLTTSSLIPYPLNATQSPAPHSAVTPSSAPDSAVVPSAALNSAAPAPPSPHPAPIPNTHPMQTRSKNAMQDEYDALIRQGTWSLVPPPQNHNIVGCKWVYKLKTHSDGSIARYKARLVAKGFHQQQGIDFDETFSPVIKPPTVRMILSLAVSLNWPLRQLDVSNAFLHGILKEEVYMSQPQGYISAQHPDYVCRLHKSIYGLKQTPRAWFERFTGQLIQFGFIASAAGSSLFIYKSKTIIAYLLLYVDDIVTRDSKGLHLSQAKYATALLQKHNMTTTKPISTPCTPNTRLSLHDGEKLHDPHAYRSLVGALHYLTFTRPDLSFAVHQGTLHLGLSFRPGPLTLSAFTDADWAGDLDDRRSTSEYRALALASAEVRWLRTLLKDLGVFISEAPILWCDNISALAIASNPVFHARTKHIEVDFHFVHERVLRKDLAVKFVSTLDQLADIFTKSLPAHRFLDLRSNLMATVRPPELEEGC